MAVDRDRLDERAGKPESARAVVANFRDITDRKHAEEALKEADRRKDEFIAMLAHKLRNPLAAMSTPCTSCAMSPGRKTLSGAKT